MLDLFAAHGYQLVMPPLLEYVESLLTGTGHDLDLQDIQAGRPAVRAHAGACAPTSRRRWRASTRICSTAAASTRLCYAGSVLHTLPAGMNRTREPLQIGAEIYGHAGIESDLEVQRLMLTALRLRRRQPRASRHRACRGVPRAGAARAASTRELEAELFRAVQAKDVPALARLVRRSWIAARGAALLALPELVRRRRSAGRGARAALPDYPEIRRALRATARRCATRCAMSAPNLCFDLGELRGYHYHSGVVFAAYADGCAECARAGRALRRGRQGVRPRAAGDRIQHGFARSLAAAGAGSRATAAILAPYRPRDARAAAPDRGVARARRGRDRRSARARQIARRTRLRPPAGAARTRRGGWKRRIKHV